MHTRDTTQVGCLYSCLASLMPVGREAVPDTIGLVKVNLVRRLSAKSVMGHSGIVLFDVEIDQLVVPQSVVRREMFGSDDRERGPSGRNSDPDVRCRRFDMRESSAAFAVTTPRGTETLP